MIYIILGVYKSGTTLVSQILHHSGINMVEDIKESKSYDEGNKYERKSTLDLNQDILKSEKTLSIYIKIPVQTHMTPDQRSHMRQIVMDCSQKYPDWGFKDPRTCLTYPLWASEIPEHRLIIVYREAAELWRRYRHWNPARVFFRSWNFVKTWCVYNAKLIDYAEKTNLDYLVINYRRLMTTQDEFNRLQAFLGKPLNDQRQMSLYRGKDKSYSLLRATQWLYGNLTGLKTETIKKQLDVMSI